MTLLLGKKIVPLLDEAMARLDKKNRDAVMLRYFKERSHREVAEALQVTEAAAQRRVLRVVEKLRAIKGTPIGRCIASNARYPKKRKSWLQASFFRQR